MRRFQFRLETVLEWRRLQVEAEEIKLRRLFEDLRQLELACERVRAERTDAERQVLYANTTDAIDLGALEAHRRHAGRNLERLSADKIACERRIAEQRTRLVEAERGMRLLEKLKEKQLTEWQAAVNREQEATAAELFLGQWRPGARGSGPHRYKG